MTFKRPYGAGLAALAVGLFAATAAYAEPTVNKGDNAWMLTSTVLVLLMTIPGGRDEARGYTLMPLTVTTTVRAVPSALVTTKLSVTELPAGSACTLVAEFASV